MSDHEQTYAFDNAASGQRERLRALEAVLDPGTLHHLEASGFRSGWHCLEVGAGAGSVALWLAERVGSDGSVLATDLDLTELRRVTHERLSRRVHDVLRDALPEEHFDLVHVRLVLGWLPDPALAVRRLVASLKPGGLLLAEELDFSSAVADPAMPADSAAVVTRVLNAHLAVLADRHGFDSTCGRRLSGLLAQAGLIEVRAEGRATMWRGGEAGGELWRLTFTQLRQAMLDAGTVTAPDVDRAVGLCRDGLSFVSPLTLAAWGTRPERAELRRCARAAPAWPACRAEPESAAPSP